VPAGPRRAAYRRVSALNVRAEDRAAMSRDVEGRLRLELDPEVVALERLLERSLAAWRAA